MKTMEMKRREAQIRQTAHDVLTPQEKLIKLDQVGHRAAKEREKLHDQMALERKLREQEQREATEQLKRKHSKEQGRACVRAEDLKSKNKRGG